MKKPALSRPFLATFLLCFSSTSDAFSVIVSTDSSRSLANGNKITQSLSRKSFLGTLIGGVFISPLPSLAKASQPTSTAQDEINTIREASSTLTTLLNNWQKATVECIFADVPRELLETKNKEQLLEKASTFALFDKSVSVVSCKKSNKIVRDYLGVTGKGPLVNVDKKMLKRGVVEFVDPDDLDTYFTEVESFQGAISRASAASYTAGVADFDSMNNFEKGSQKDESDSNLEQARRAIGDAKVSIERIVAILDKNAQQT